MRRARFCVGGDYETAYTETTFCSHHSLVEGFSNSIHRIASLSISKLDVTTITRAIGVCRAYGDAMHSDHVLAAVATYF